MEVEQFERSADDDVPFRPDSSIDNGHHDYPQRQLSRHRILRMSAQQFRQQIRRDLYIRSSFQHFPSDF
jgi:hypothetical protein